MTTMTPPEADTLWAAIDDQRACTADALEHLTPPQWEHPSLCEGWTVRHVAVHLTLQRQGLGDVLSLVAHNPSLLRSLTLNRTIHDSAVLLARRLSDDQVIDGIRVGIGSRRHNAFVTPLETLTDILVHSQDIALPLGLDLAMDPVAARRAATRRWDTRRSWMSAVFHRLPVDDYRLTATDVDWTRGQGPDVTGPIAAHLLLLTGRRVALDALSGEGADQLRAGDPPASP